MMQISETTFTVSRSGALKIPVAIIRAMGLGPGCHVRVAYLTRNGEENTFRELLLSPHGIEHTADDETVAVPNALLREAHISAETDIQILCLDGCIIICRDGGIRPEDLAELVDSLQSANDFADSLSHGSSDILERLNDMINSEAEGLDNE